MSSSIESAADVERMAATPASRAQTGSPWTPPGAEPPWAERVGVAGVYLFAFFAWLGTAGANLGLGLMLFATCWQGRAFARAMRRGGLWFLLGWFALALLLSTALAVGERSHGLRLQLGGVQALLKLWGFVLVAWCLAGDQRRLLRVFAVALVGFALGRLKAFDWTEAGALLQGLRVGFNLSPIAFGQYMAAILLGLVLLAPRLWENIRRRPSEARVVVIVGWVVLVLVTIQGVIVGQSRGVWLAMLLIFPPLCLIQWRRILAPTRRRRTSWRLVAIILVGAMGMLYLNRAVIVERWAVIDKTTIESVWSGSAERIDNESPRARVLMLRLGLERWLERPWLGWGPGATPYLIKESGIPDLARFNDLHDGYLEMLVRLGVLGATPLFAVFVLVFVFLWRAYRNKQVAQDVFLFVLGCLALHLLVNLSNFRMLNMDWRFYWYLFAGAALTFRLRALAVAPVDTSPRAASMPPRS